MVFNEHGIQTFVVVVVMLLLLLLSFDIFVPTSAHTISLYTFGQVGCQNILECQLVGVHDIIHIQNIVLWDNIVQNIPSLKLNFGNILQNIDSPT